MDDESKKWIYKFFSVLTEDELYRILLEFYEVAYNDGQREEMDFEDSIKWTLADNTEIENRINE